MGEYCLFGEKVGCQSVTKYNTRATAGARFLHRYPRHHIIQCLLVPARCRREQAPALCQLLSGRHLEMKRTDRVTWATAATLFLLAFACSILAAESEKKTPPTMQNARDGAEMILIPGGRFLMGSTRAEVDAQ